MSRCTVVELETAYENVVSQVGSWREVCGIKASGALEHYWEATEQGSLDGDDEDGWRNTFEHSLFGPSRKTDKAVRKFLKSGQEKVIEREADNESFGGGDDEDWSADDNQQWQLRLKAAVAVQQE